MGKEEDFSEKKGNYGSLSLSSEEEGSEWWHVMICGICCLTIQVKDQQKCLI
tara:strand:- start:74 stop:229 length:156 start_codon:yes stop_codon:yes gene_type:complete